MIPYSFVPQTVIRSAEVNANFAVLSASGIIQMYGGDVAPTGWLLCDGTNYLRASYTDLFAVIGSKFGSVDGTHFNVPDFRGRVGVGKDGTTAFLIIGTAGGEKTHQLTTAETPSHNHGSRGGYGSFTMHGQSFATTIAGYSGIFGVTNANTGYHSNSTTAGATSYGGITIDTTHTHDTVGSDGGHNNLQPYLTINYIIKI
jgi:microcystin-dependent protein